MTPTVFTEYVPWLYQGSVIIPFINHDTYGREEWTDVNGVRCAFKEGCLDGFLS